MVKSLRERNTMSPRKQLPPPTDTSLPLFSDAPDDTRPQPEVETRAPDERALDVTFLAAAA